MGMAYDIYCDYKSEKPIEALIKTIYILQYIDECEEECQMLRDKLEKHFEDIPAIDNVKTYGDYIYQPNGYCVNKEKRTKREFTAIIANPWVLEHEEQLKEKKYKRTYDGLCRLNFVWYTQLKAYLGRQMPMSSMSHHKPYSGDYDKEYHTLHQTMTNVARVSALKEEELEYVNIDHAKTEYADSVHYNMDYLLGRSSYYSFGSRRGYDHKDTEITFLTEDALKFVLAVYDSVAKDESAFDYNEHDKIILALERGLVGDCLVHTGITVKDLLIHRDIRNRDGYAYRTDTMYGVEEFENIFWPKMKELFEDNPSIKSMFEKLKWIEKPKRSKKKKESVEDGEEKGARAV